MQTTHFSHTNICNYDARHCIQLRHFFGRASISLMPHPAILILRSAFLLLFVLISLLPFLSCAAIGPYSPPPLLGFHPDVRKHWESGGVAACDGRPLPLASVNDGVCDCADGRCCCCYHVCLRHFTSQVLSSDEPATGACPNSLFYCPNTGHQGSFVAVSRVNGDGFPLE